MMLRNQILTKCDYAINNLPTSTVKAHHLCWFNNRIQCLPRGHTKKPHKIFCYLLPKALSDGLSPKEWNWIERNIFIYLKEIGQCH